MDTHPALIPDKEVADLNKCLLVDYRIYEKPNRVFRKQGFSQVARISA